MTHNHNLDKSAQILIDTLRRMGKTVTFAESCTGGLCAKTITDLPGASDVFHGSAVTYENSVKEALLGVSGDLLRTQGAVCADVAIQMAQGVRSLMSADYAAGITGIAGPGGGSEQKPVGTVFAAVCGPDGICRVLSLCPADFASDLSRNGIRQETVRRVLLALLEICGAAII